MKTYQTVKVSGLSQRTMTEGPKVALDEFDLFFPDRLTDSLRKVRGYGKITVASVVHGPGVTIAKLKPGSAKYYTIELLSPTYASHKMRKEARFASDKRLRNILERAGEPVFVSGEGRSGLRARALKITRARRSR